eukprot:5460677-Alexandrium_andersonii.AAC.1
MSASLVGSEMCIRDSSNPRPGPTMCSARTPSRRGPQRSSGAGLPRGWGRCLLYTSDAADDM